MATEFNAKEFLRQVTQRPGIYQMYAEEGEILYVGKAKNLKNRLSSYFRGGTLAPKTNALVEKIARIEVTVTGSETEALLLEQNLIKQQRPPYNILLRDDKSFPYLYVSTQDEFPSIRFRRGSKTKKGRLFGPYTSSAAVRESLVLLQKVFRVRSCDESFFRNRSRPCLQYQIRRCKAPCVGLISTEDYAEDVRHTLLFLEGKNNELGQELATRMEQASEALEFEHAAVLRDQISYLQKVQEQQIISGREGDADVFACVIRPGGACVQVLNVRAGRVLGSRVYFPKLAVELAEPELISSFLGQYYLGKKPFNNIPTLIVTSHEPEDRNAFEGALSASQGRSVRISHRVRGERNAWLRLALTNAEQQLGSHLANKDNVYRRFIKLQQELGLDFLPERLECFDISHSSGEATVASCVVFDHNGPLKSDYRRFNIEGITPGDDFAAMEQALMRRYQKLKVGEGALPDLVIIDGGIGQLSRAAKVFNELQLSQVSILGIAKGPTRKPGLERLFLNGQELRQEIPADSSALHLLQHIRDESHRFAITGHRQRRAKPRRRSKLEEIDGIGPKRRKELLRHFGGVQQIQQASVEEIAKVNTISRILAESVYQAFHGD